MEYMPKDNLDAVIKNEGKHIKLHLRLSMLCDAARGMTYLHEQNISHGDLKPLNLFVSSDYKVKVGDFGLAVMTKGNDETEVHGFTPGMFHDVFLSCFFLFLSFSFFFFILFVLFIVLIFF